MREKNYNSKYWDSKSSSRTLLTRFTTSQDNFGFDTAKLEYPFRGLDTAVSGPQQRSRDNGNWTNGQFYQLQIINYLLFTNFQFEV